MIFAIQNAVATWHKLPNPGGAISTKNVIFPIQGAQFWLKISYFQSRGQDFDQICPTYNPGGTILICALSYCQHLWYDYGQIHHKIHFKYLVWYLLLFKVFKL